MGPASRSQDLISVFVSLTRVRVGSLASAGQWRRTGPNHPSRCRHPQTPVGPGLRQWPSAELVLLQAARPLAPLLAPLPVRDLSLLASDLEPPYGIEP